MAIKVFYCNNTHTNLFFEVHIVTAKENKKRLAKPRHRIDLTPPPPPQALCHLWPRVFGLESSREG